MSLVRGALSAIPDRLETPLEDMRVLYETLAPPVDADDGATVEKLSIAGRDAEFTVPAGADATAAILYLHGGGYCLGSLNTHRRLARSIAAAAGVAVLAIDYRLAPEHPCPAAVDDALAAWRWLLDRGFAPSRVAFSGDSAGGGLTIATMVAARDAGMSLPGAAFCISPWVELANNLPSMAAKASVDPMIGKARLDMMTAIYLAGRPVGDELASPLHADLTGLPPVLIHVGSAECLLDDSVRLAGALGAAGVEARLEIWPQMIHVWHFFAPMLSEGRDAIVSAGAWLKEKLRE